MKKEEALLLIPDRSKLLIEYIKKILSNDDTIKGNIILSSYKIEGQNMCTLNISVPDVSLDKHINLEITADHADLLCAQIFKDFLSTFLEHDTIGVSRCYTVKYNVGENFTGVKAINSNGGELKINFLCGGVKFDELAHEYNKAINEYVDRHTISEQSKIEDRKARI